MSSFLAIRGMFNVYFDVLDLDLSFVFEDCIESLCYKPKFEVSVGILSWKLIFKSQVCSWCRKLKLKVKVQRSKLKNHVEYL